MNADRLVLAESLIGELADQISNHSLLKYAVRWGVEQYGTGENANSVVPLQQVDFTNELPAMRTTIEEPNFRSAADAMLARMGVDISQLDADFTDVRSPVIIVLTTGSFVDSEVDLDAAVRDLLTRNPRIDQDREWAPTILFLGLLVGEQAPLERLVRAHDAVDEYAVAGEDDIIAVSRKVVAALHESVLTGALHLRYARWVVDEKDLATGTVLDRTAEAETIEVTAHPVTDAAAPLVYRRFLDLGQDADTHPLEALIDLVAITRATPPAPGEPAVTTRACWPVRVVVGDDPRTPIGLLVPTVPLKYADTDGAGRPVPRSISLLRLNDSASAPVARESVPATTDAVARLKICADLADTLDLMHLYGVVLGTRTLESGVFRVLRRSAEVHLADCGDARLRDPAESHGAVADLAWLGRFIEQCLVDRSGRMDVHTTTVFDQTGLDLLARAKSNVPSATPTASQWRSYLARRAVELQGPPVLKSATVEPRFAPIGEAVEVRWSTRYADSMEVIGPDGTAQPVPAQRTDSGTVTVTVTTSGPVTLLLRNPMGEVRHETKWVHVFGYPRLTQVPVPAAPPFTSTRTLHELGDLIGSTRMLGSDAARSALAGPPAFDPLAALTQPRRRSWRSRLSRPEPNVAPAFPQDVSSWFFQRPEKFRFPRKKWWRLPWG